MKSEEIPTNFFDRGKPFYPLIMSYLILLHGHIELISRDLKNQFGKNTEKIDKSLHKNIKPNNKYLERIIKSNGNTVLLNNLKLKRETKKNPIEIDHEKLAEEVTKHSPYLSSHIMRAAGSLLILAWETTQELDREGPLWEFLRHCRHAAAHNGKFKFKVGEPKKKAKWRKIEITRSFEGKELFKNKLNKGLLSPGDPIDLLWDIEQTIEKNSI